MDVTYRPYQAGSTESGGTATMPPLGREASAENGGYAGLSAPPPPNPPSGYPAPPYQPLPPRRRRGWTIVAIVAAAVLGLAGGYFLAQPGTAVSTVLGGSNITQTDSTHAVVVGVVDITTKYSNEQGGAAGTGLVLTSDGTVLTNNHVIRGATSISVTDASGRDYPATVVGYDRTHDVAVLRLQGASNLKTVPLGDSESVQLGDHVTAIGNAGGVGGSPAQTSGTVTGLDVPITASDESGGDSQQLTGLIQVNAPLQSGDSGGALVDSSGKVIGMNVAAAQASQRSGNGYGTGSGSTAGYAIPINTVVSIAKQIQDGKASSTVHIGGTAFLGVELAPSNAAEDTIYGRSGQSGVMVLGVQANSPAALAGLAAGDVITAVDGRAVDSSDALQDVLLTRRPGDQVALQWTDQSGTPQTATVRLAEGPPA